jgi:hypothetical protein
MTLSNESSPGRLICALCKKPVRSLYALPGERGAKLCAACFFSPLPTADPLPGNQSP